MAKGQGLDHGIPRANIHGEVEDSSTHCSSAYASDRLLLMRSPMSLLHELVEFKSHDACNLYESELPDDIINERMLAAAEPKLSEILQEIE